LPSMKYVVVIDNIAHGRPTRIYLRRLRGGHGRWWGWTDQRCEATEFAGRNEAQQIVETKMRLKSGVLIVPVSDEMYGDPAAMRDY